MSDRTTISVQINYEIDVPTEDLEGLLDDNDCERDRGIWYYLDAYRDPTTHQEELERENVRYYGMEVSKNDDD